MTHLVSIAYTPGLTVSAGMRVLFNGRYFTIQTVTNVQERNRVLQLSCTEINGGEATA